MTTLMVVLISCNSQDEINLINANIEEPDALELSEPNNPDSLDFRVACTTVTDACGSGNFTNCVKYARCKQPKLPYNLFTYQDKLNIINTQTAKAGYVAIINVGNDVGHVAYVQSVKGTVITIRETNWCSTTKVSTRSNTKASLKIVGYFKP